jgi:site-specific DNA-cytosine methylase
MWSKVPCRHPRDGADHLCHPPHDMIYLCRMCRYFSPQEVANLLGFPRTFSFPATITARQQYKLLGNSVCVPMLTLLLEHIVAAQGD